MNEYAIKKICAIRKKICIFAPPKKSPDGGIGRRAGLKNQFFRECRFDSGSGYEEKKPVNFTGFFFTFSAK